MASFPGMEDDLSNKREYCRRRRNFVHRYQDYVEQKKDYLEKRQNYLRMKENYIARRRDYLGRGKGILARELKQKFLVSKGEFLASKGEFLASKDRLATKKVYLTRKQGRDEDYFTRVRNAMVRDFLEGLLITTEEMYKKVVKYMEWITESLILKSVLQILFTKWKHFFPYFFSPFNISLDSRRANISRYDVFLSFRGKDVRMTLVHHLFPALCRAGLRVFLDSNNLKKGELIWPALETAIKKSAICIPIFSQGYADSSWCLKEATAMLSSRATIIPLFYGVDPTHVRYPLKNSSPYMKSFEKHYGRHPKEEIDRWLLGLGEICSRSGWTVDITEEYARG